MNPFPTLSDPTYRIESELGSGGGGVVYKAWHTRLNMHVVLKELRIGSKADLETQRNEVEALKNVKSAYLPQIYDFMTEGSRVFTVIEYIEGDSLDKLLAQGVIFTQPQIIKWYNQLIEALGVIHKKNICHRDVKPANIMLTPSGDVCLIDFNAALVSGNDIRLVSRSLGYASPEQFEIFECFRRSKNAPINLTNSGISADASINPATDICDDDNKTELYDSQVTDLIADKSGPETDLDGPTITDGIDWKLSDIYSLGATMYHLLTGIHPPARTEELVPLSRYEAYSEGIIFVIDHSMQKKPSDRFASITALSDAVKNIYKHDSKWKKAQARQMIAALLLPVLFGLCVLMTFYGYNVMGQEKEERFYAVIHEIGTTKDYRDAYELALSMYHDRIDPYYTMAVRLWNDGDLESCREYIEANLGNIAKFQENPDAAVKYGDIYYILGNCYYQKHTEKDYLTAREYFEIALQYSADNPYYYRDYAIALARTGSSDKAKRILERAMALNLASDSLNLIQGEINFADGVYDEALSFFEQVIFATTDDYLRYRAFHTMDEIYQIQGQPEKSVALLSAALNRIPLNRVSEMTERLADAHVKGGSYNEAIRLFTELAEKGAPQFHLFHNLAILLHNAGEFDAASDALSKMEDLFPDDYRVAMRQTFLEIDKQMQLENTERDYYQAQQYYEKASVLYKMFLKPGTSDPEMQQLSLVIDQLRAYGWIE